MMETNNENMVEFLTGSPYITVTFTAKKWVNRAKKLYEDRPEDFKYFVENKDGSICAKVSQKYFKFSPPKKVSEAQRQAAAERFRQMHEDGLLTKKS